MKFEWDNRKAQANLAKHGVSFDTAVKALDDPYRMESYQRRSGEDRWKAIAREGDRIYAIAYTEHGDTVRIISAREAEKHEKSTYRRQAY